MMLCSLLAAHGVLRISDLRAGGLLGLLPQGRGERGGTPEQEVVREAPLHGGGVPASRPVLPGRELPLGGDYEAVHRPLGGGAGRAVRALQGGAGPYRRAHLLLHDEALQVHSQRGTFIEGDEFGAWGSIYGGGVWAHDTRTQFLHAVIVDDGSNILSTSSS